MAPPAALPLRRWVALLALLLGEGLALGIRFDADTLAGLPPGWWTALIRNAGALVRIGAVVFAALFLVAGARVRRGLSPALTADLARHRATPYLIGHVVCFGALVALSTVVFRDQGAPSAYAAALVAGWLGALALTLGSWVLTVVPPRRVPALLRSYAPVLAGALVVGVGAAAVGVLSQRLWLPLRRVTFALSSTVLRAFARDVVVDPANLAFGARGFIVEIAPQCSGYEGVGLTWVFLLVALWLFRDRLRFPRALWLLAIGPAVSFAANIVRLVALVLVGAYLSPEIGAGGFHSYAGTLLFCAVALATVALALRSRWLTRPAAVAGGRGVVARAAVEGATVNPAAPYLVPYLALVAAGLISRAFSVDDREPLFALRPIVGAATLAVYARTYRQPGRRLSWRPTWIAVPIGVVVVALWLGVDRLLPVGGGASAPAAPTMVGLTLAARLLTTILIVPVVEEMAFRGFLARRISAAAFDELPPQAISVAGVLLSSLAFGLLHRRIVAGVLAGVCYALAYRARGRLGDAVIAHATTNMALVIVAWWSGDWGLWM